MLIIFKKENNHIVGNFSDSQKFGDIYEGNSYALNNLGGMIIDDELLPNDDIRDYKLVDGQFVKLTTEELPVPNESPTMTEINKLKEENLQLNQSLMETQQAIAELSMMMSTPPTA